MPAISLPNPSPTARHCQPLQLKKIYRSERFSTPAYFHDEELQDLEADAQLTTQHAHTDREAILLWASAVSPGLDEVPPSPTLSILMSTGLDERPCPFPLTAQNLAPPCVTVAPRHISLQTTFHSRYEDCAPSLSQDDGSVLTPATDSLIAPSIPDASAPPTNALIHRVVSKVRSWVAFPSHVHKGKRNTDDPLVHSDQTVRVHQLPTYRTTFDSPRSYICQSDADFAGDCCDSDVM
ncbi:hypothetical protein BU17DRAFT_91457 [Hysterangium stoloniferum]|nr:hypothetical protein BU17DRAFT_91457 [Hysterangium stoloniferum]